jgi:hypothetical protein
LVYNVVVRKLTYQEKYLKGEMVNIYQKPQALINYLLDKFSNEGDWVLDLFWGSSKNYDLIFMKPYFNKNYDLIFMKPYFNKNYDLIFMKPYFNLRLFLICIFTVSNFIIYFVFGD